MTVCLMDKAHIAHVAAIEAECFTSPWSEAALERLITSQGFGVVAIEDRRAAAYGGMLLVLDEGQITNVATSARYRRRGLARAVMLEMLRIARERGITTLSLEVRASNEGAIALYRTLGFTVAGTRKGFYTNPREDALVMIKTFY